MFKNYLTLAWRNLTARKGFSFINIIGLAIGMAAAILIVAWVQNEYSFDTFHANKNTLYKVWNRSKGPGEIGCWDVTAGPIAKALKDNYPEIKGAARVYWSSDRLFAYRDRSIKATGNDVDKDFLTMFTFPLVKGNPNHALDDANGVVITEQLAKRIFGTTDPMNQLLKVDNKDLYKVTGVVKDLPNNTQFDFDYLVSLPAEGLYNSDNSWNTGNYNTYVQLQPNAHIDLVNEKIKDLVSKHDPGANNDIFLHPITKWHLYSNFENGKVAGGRISTVRLMLAIAGIILLIACINFMNLSTAQSQKRAREVGVRKVIGARRTGLIGQFLTESILICFLAGLLALSLAQLCLPAFNQLTGKRLVLDYADPLFWLALAVFILITGLIAGSYPAFFLSALRPVKVLKGALTPAKTLNPRKILVVLQFAAAVIFIICTLTIYRQIQFAQSRDIGYNRNHLIEVPPEGDIRKNLALIKNDLLNTGAATAMSGTSYTVTIDGSTANGFSWEKSTPDQLHLTFTRFGTEGDFVHTMGLHLIAGRDIDFTNYPTDSTACLLNETAIKQMGIKDPIGKFFYTAPDAHRVIVGVFKDFIINSPYSPTGPMIVLASKSWVYNTVIRLNPANSQGKDLQLAAQVFKKYNPAYPFTFHFIDQEYQQKFDDQQQTGKFSAIFAGLTIFISCLGLFALAAYMTESRAKEIGIRKVLGASVTGIVQMLSREVIVLVIIAILFAVPFSWWIMNKWLQDFTYRIQLGWMTFALAGLSALVIAIATVSFHSIKGALTNPVKSIRTE